MKDSESLRLDAQKVEALMPLAMRALYRQDSNDPLLEYTVPQLRLLRSLRGGPRTASVLGEDLGLSVSAITQMANRLEGAGLLSRSDDEGDRRIKHLSLTERGKELLAERRSRRVGQAQEALTRLSKHRREQLITALEALVSSVGTPDGKQPHLLVAELELRLPPAS